MIKLRNPRPDEVVALTDLCLRSKAVWGYDQQFMEACRGELTFAAADLGWRCIQVAETDGRVMGVVEVTAKGEEAELTKLFSWSQPIFGRASVGNSSSGLKPQRTLLVRVC